MDLCPQTSFLVLLRVHHLFLTSPWQPDTPFSRWTCFLAVDGSPWEQGQTGQELAASLLSHPDPAGQIAWPAWLLMSQSSWCQSLSRVSTVSPKNMSSEHSIHSSPPYTSEHSLHVSDNAWLYVQKKENHNLRTTERGTGLIHGFVVIVASTLFTSLVFGTNRDHTCGFTSVLTGFNWEQQNQLVGGRVHYTYKSAETSTVLLRWWPWSVQSPSDVCSPHTSSSM